MRIWTYKNADEKEHTLSSRSKNVKKRTKTYEKRILCKFTLKLYLELVSRYIRKLDRYKKNQKIFMKFWIGLIVITSVNSNKHGLFSPECSLKSLLVSEGL